jgi:hypothetical protein
VLLAWACSLLKGCGMECGSSLSEVRHVYIEAGANAAHARGSKRSVAGASQSGRGGARDANREVESGDLG